MDSSNQWIARAEPEMREEGDQMEAPDSPIEEKMTSKNPLSQSTGSTMLEPSIVEIQGKKMPLDEYLRNHHANRQSKSAQYTQKQGRLVVKNLNYTINVPKEPAIKTVPSILKYIFSLAFVFRRPEMIKKKVLDDISFTLEPGEMTVLIGAPGSGKTSLMDVISRRRKHRERKGTFEGELRLNGETPNKRTWTSEVAYVLQTDVHHPLLTVEETFRFAASLKLPDIYEKEDVKEQVNLIMQLLHLTHAKDTILGNDLIRGVSGGELRRVTVGVAWLKHPSFFLVDQPTRGLDSAAALRLGKDLKTLASFGTPVLCSLLQPSPQLFKQFKTVIILTDGQIAYWGPREECQAYFENLGYRCPPQYSFSEFLATVVDRPEKFIDDDVEANPGPRPQVTTTQGFIEAWKQSDLKKRMDLRFQNDVTSPVRNDPAVQVETETHPPKFARSRLFQFKMLLWRGAIILKRDWRRFLFRELNDTLVAFFIATFFFRLDNDQYGSRDKVSMLFFALTYLGYSGLATIPILFLDKTIMSVQRKAKLYAVSVWLLASMILQVPFALFNALVFGTFTYWVVGLNGAADRYFFYMLVLFTVYLVGITISFLSTLSMGTPIIASIMGALLLVLFFTLSGFLAPYNLLPNGWHWGYWSSYYQYALNAVKTNQFVGETLYCTDEERLPPPGIQVERFQGNSVCEYTTGEQYLESFQGFTYFDARWWLWAVVVGWVIFFGLLAYVVVLLKKRDPLKILPRSKVQKVTNVDTKNALKNSNPAALTFKDVVYTVGKGSDEKRLLNGISGVIKPGMFLGLMGASGAGKTTLLDVLARRKTSGKIDGEFRINGREISDEVFPRYIGYVEQNDLFYAHHTVWEALEFSAKCRLKPETTPEERDAIIQRVLEILGIEDLADMLIGQPGQSLRKEQMKKISVAIELVAQPRVLFLDEPTSGLDAIGADTIMEAVANVAKSGTAVVCTIHQPSQRIFLRMSHLLLLLRGGKTAYFGPIGDLAEDLLGYFKDNFQLEPKDGKNPADFIVDNIQQLAPDAEDPKFQFDPQESWKNSQRKQDMDNDIAAVLDNPPELEEIKSAHALSWGAQFKALYYRFFLAYLRDPKQSLFGIMRSIFVGLLAGTVFYDAGYDQEGSQTRLNAIFFLTLTADLAAFTTIISIFQLRPLFYKERSQRYYGSTSFGLAKWWLDAPIVLMESFITFVIMYFMIGFERTASHFFFFFLVFLGLYIVTTQFAQMFAVLSGDVDNAGFVYTTLLILNVLASGFLIPRSRIPNWWIWVYWISFQQYTLHPLVLDQYQGVEFYCPNNRGAVAVPVGNSTEYYCPVTSGEDIVRMYDLIPEIKWPAIGALYGYYFIFLIISLLALKFVNHLKR